ncbi:hypothetical protein BD770DRAFT_387938 [Pilaira anomala]|nr:hypothetical protein BD770DRAFT_387938 [Pilaira anomala]
MNDTQFNRYIEQEKIRRENYYQELSLTTGRSVAYIRKRMSDETEDVPHYKKNTSINAWCIFRSEEAARRKAEAEENKTEYEGLESSAASIIYKALPVEKKLELQETAARAAAAASCFISETEGYLKNVALTMKSLKALNCDGIFLATYPSKEDPSKGITASVCTGDAKLVFKHKIKSMEEDLMKYRFPATVETSRKRPALGTSEGSKRSNKRRTGLKRELTCLARSACGTLAKNMPWKKLDIEGINYLGYV